MVPYLTVHLLCNIAVYLIGLTAIVWVWIETPLFLARSRQAIRHHYRSQFSADKQRIETLNTERLTNTLNILDRQVQSIR